MSVRKKVFLIDIPAKKPFMHRLNPTQIIVIGFLGVVLLGTFLLMLPISSAERIFTPFVDALFTATSATCVTGLVVVETGVYWSLFGKIVILMLIQIGGLGIMSVAFLFSLAAKRRITPRERLMFAQSLGISDLSGIVRFAKFIVFGTFAIEAIGATLLAFRFIPRFGILRGIGHSIFHSVSAFCNAGFDILGTYNSVSDYAADPLVSILLSVLVIFGGLGFFVWRDLVMCLKKQSKLSPYSKIVLVTTGTLLAVGTLLLFAFECENPYFDRYSRPKLFLCSFFQSAVTRTAGFFSVPLNELSSPSKAISIALMFIGGASGSTAGGIKVGTLAVVIIAIIAIFKGSTHFNAFKRAISLNNVLRAMGILAISISVVALSAFTICLVEPQFTFAEVLYEVTSAFATVGQTLGITPYLGVFSKLLITALMFFGRVGILTITYAILFKQSKNENLISYPEANVLLG